MGFSEETTLGSKNLGMELDGIRKLKPRRAWVDGSAKIFFLNVLKGIGGSEVLPITFESYSSFLFKKLDLQLTPTE